MKIIGAIVLLFWLSLAIWFALQEIQRARSSRRARELLERLISEDTARTEFPCLRCGAGTRKAPGGRVCPGCQLWY